MNFFLISICDQIQVEILLLQRVSFEKLKKKPQIFFFLLITVWVILVKNIISDKKLEDAKGYYPLVTALPEAAFRPGSLKDKP